jgi:hypothetical protein
MNAAQDSAVKNFQDCTLTTLQYGGIDQANAYAEWASAQLLIGRGAAAATEFTAWWLTHPANAS